MQTEAALTTQQYAQVEDAMTNCQPGGAGGTASSPTPKSVPPPVENCPEKNAEKLKKKDAFSKNKTCPSKQFAGSICRVSIDVSHLWLQEILDAKASLRKSIGEARALVNKMSEQLAKIIVAKNDLQNRGYPPEAQQQ